MKMKLDEIWSLYEQMLDAREAQLINSTMLNSWIKQLEELLPYNKTTEEE